MSWVRAIVTALAFAVCACHAVQRPDVHREPARPQVGDWTEHLVHVELTDATLYRKWRMTILEEQGDRYLVRGEHIRCRTSAHSPVDLPLDRLEFDQSEPRVMSEGWLSALALNQQWWHRSRSGASAEGRETIHISDAAYVCRWHRFVNLRRLDDGERESATITAWLSPGVPLGGLVKMVERQASMTRTSILVGHGWGHGERH